MKIIKRFFIPAFFLALLAACASTSGQVIGGDPRTYLLQQADLPDSAAYYMPENETFLIPNETAIGAFGQETGQKLIDETARVNSGRVHYQRSEGTGSGPAYYVATVTLHQNAEGAQAAVSRYNIASLFPDGGWAVLKDPPAIGDLTVVETGQAASQSGQKVINYRVEFAYRNVSVDVLVAGLEKDVTLEMAAKAARAVLARLKMAPLSEPPIPTPAPATVQ